MSIARGYLILPDHVRRALFKEGPVPPAARVHLTSEDPASPAACPVPALCRLGIATNAVPPQVSVAVTVRGRDAAPAADDALREAELVWRPSRDSPALEATALRAASGAWRLEFGAVRAGAGHRVALRIGCPRAAPVVAKAVTVRPRLPGATGDAALWGPHLAGIAVAPGACVATPHGDLDVVTIDGAPPTAVALLEPGLRVRVNRHMGRLERGPKEAPASTVLDGLHTDVVARCAALLRAPSGGRCGALVVGGRRCGKSTVADRVVAECGLETFRCAVTDDPAAEALRCITAATGPCLLIMNPCPHFFPCDDAADAEEGTATLVLKTLGRAAHPVAVLGVAPEAGVLHPDARAGLFPFVATVDPPDAEQRAALIAWRAPDYAAAVGEGGLADRAQRCAALSTAEVLAFADLLAADPDAPAPAPVDAAAEGPARAVKLQRGVEWSSIGGVEGPKALLQRHLVLPITKPATFQRLGITPCKGVLLYGPPGCAKTTLVKALCSGGHFTLLSLDCASVLSAYVGEAERRIRQVFEQARRLAPAVVFFDEVDAIARRRSRGAGDNVSTRLLSALLTEMDGVGAAREVCFIGATNLPDTLDDAVLRPGRFDQLVHVPLPCEPDRAAIARSVLGGVLEADWAALAAVSGGMSGADISSGCRAYVAGLLKHGRALEAYSCEEHTAALAQALEADRPSAATVATIEARYKTFADRGA